MTCYCFLRNVHDITRNGHTAYKARFGEEFNGPILPFGCGIKFKPSSPKDIGLLPKFGDKLLDGIFVGYVQRAGGGWSGDIEVIDAIDLTNAQTVDDIHVKRVSAQEITVLKTKNGSFSFPILEEGWEQPVDSRYLIHI